MRTRSHAAASVAAPATTRISSASETEKKEARGSSTSSTSDSGLLVPVDAVPVTPAQDREHSRTCAVADRPSFPARRRSSRLNATVLVDQASQAKPAYALDIKRKGKKVEDCETSDSSESESDSSFAHKQKKMRDYDADGNEESVALASPAFRNVKSIRKGRGVVVHRSQLPVMDIEEEDASIHIDNNTEGTSHASQEFALGHALPDEPISGIGLAENVSGVSQGGSEQREDLDYGARQRRRQHGQSSRARFLDIARRRAAHFAHFDPNGNEAPAGELPHPLPTPGHRCRLSLNPGRPEPESVPEPRASIDWPGPFSTARQLVANRAAAAASRGKACNVGDSVSLVDWTPSRVPGDPAFDMRHSPSLQELALDVLASNAENVGSLDGVPEFLRARISVAFCQHRKMNAKALALFFEGEPSEIRAPDCTLISETELLQLMSHLSANRLEDLHLGFCGRALSEECLQAMHAQNSYSLPLKSVSFSGAYRLMDRGLKAFLQVCPSLTYLDLSHCSFLTDDGIKAVISAASGTLQTLILHGCDKLNARDFIVELARMPKIQRLSLAGVGGVDDEVVSELCAQQGCHLRDLSLADCSLLTDASMAAVGACCLSLAVLNLENLTLLTDVSVARIADGCRQLETLGLTRCKFRDEALASFVTASGSALTNLSVNSVRQAGDATLLALAKHSCSLQAFDASWCRKMSDEGLGFLADSCKKLRELTLFGCTQVTGKFLNGHSNCNLLIRGL